MLGALRQLFIPKPPEEAKATYIALVKAARNPFFYTTLQVPDTLDGRFEVIVLHLFLLQKRLLEGGLTPPSLQAQLTPAASGSRAALRKNNVPPENAVFAQFVSEAFFNDMDRSLRELGVADTGVSHRIKKMGKAYNGRLQAYTAGLTDPVVMRGAFARNMYGTVEQGDIALLDKFTHFTLAMTDQLAMTDAVTLTSGQYEWPDAAAL